MWIKLKTTKGDVRLVNMSHVLAITPRSVSYGVAFDYGDFKKDYDVDFDDIVSAIEEYYARKDPFEKAVRSEQERWLRGED